MRKLSQPFLAGIALLAAAVPARAQNYGRAVAVADGEVFVSEPANVVRPGIVYVYRPSAGRWAEAARLEGPDAAAGDGFGAAIAVQGATLLASRLGDDDGRGAVFVFERRSGEWRQAGRLTVGDAAAGDSVGVALALAGGRALVAAKHANGAAGAVYVFRRGQDGSWVREGVLTGSDAAEGDDFGAAVALAGDRALVGAPGQADSRGAAYLFERDAAGQWSEAFKMVARTVAEGSRLGGSVALMGEQAIVGAPGRDERTGAVYVFTRNVNDDGSWAAYTRLFPFDGGSQAMFGTGVAVVGGELWISSPGGDQYQGAIHRLTYDAAKDDWDAAVKMAYDDLSRGSFFAGSFAVTGDVAAAAIPGDDFGAGTVAIYTREGGEWAFRDKVRSDAESFPAVAGGQVDCSSGEAAGFSCDDVDLVAFLPVKDIGGRRGVRLNDVWGWTDPETGREYALVGRMDGTSFVDISDAENPVYLGDLPMTEGAIANAWRDIKVYANHAFIVADGAGEHGMQIFDLTRLRDVKGPPVAFDEDAHYDRIHSAHNIVINEETGFAFAVGSSGGGESCGGGLHMIDIRDPEQPKFAGCFADPQTGRSSTGYSHDAQCVVYHGPDEDYAGRDICMGANETALSIADVTDKASPKAIARASYPNVGYTHQGWLTADQRYFYMDDELDELQGLVSHTRTLIWDVEDLDDPQLVGEFTGTTESSDHNLYIKGDTMYQSNYQSGLRIIDIANRQAPREIGYFDTVPYGTNTPGFGGSWSNYPFFASGVIVVTSGREGVFLVKKRKPVT